MQRFAKDIAAGRLEWRLVNIQNPENRHFIQDYQLFTKSLVLVRDQGRPTEGVQGPERHLGVGGDTRTAMQQYVEKEVRDFLRKL